MKRKVKKTAVLKAAFIMMMGCAVCLTSGTVSNADEQDEVQEEDQIGIQDGDFWYIDNGIDVCLSGYKNGTENIVIPDTIGDKPVAGIYEELFKDDTDIKSISIPASVEEIRYSAFEGCTNLTEVEFREGEEEADYLKIDDFAFRNSGVEGALILPDNLTHLGEQAFAGCTAITEVTIGSELEYATINGVEAFKDCTSLMTVDLQYGVDGVSKGMFSGCTMLNSVNLAETVVSIGNEAFKNCSNIKSNDNDELILPAGLYSIGDSAFENCDGLKLLTLPGGVRIIGDSAFEGCDELVTINWSKNLSQIGDFAFKDCVKINTAWLPTGVSNIGEGAFSGCSALTSIYVPRNIVNAINLLENCNDSLVISTNDKKNEFEICPIEDYARDNNITLEYIGPEVEGYIYDTEWKFIPNADGKTAVIDRYIIAENPNERIDSDAVLYVPATVRDEAGNEYTVTGIGEYAFEGLNCRKLMIPNTVKEIGDGALGNGAVQYICIPQSVESFGKAVFAGNPVRKVYTKVSAANAIEYLTDKKIPFATVIENITIPAEFSLSTADGSKTFPVTIFPENATDEAEGVIWETDNEDVARVIGGIDYADAVSYGVGTATVTLTYINEFGEKEIKATCVITVTGDDSQDTGSDNNQDDKSNDPTNTNDKDNANNNVNNNGNGAADDKDKKDQSASTNPGTGDNASQQASNTVIKPVVNKVNNLKAVSTKKKQIKVTWKKLSGAAGYQLQYAANKKYKKAKTVNLSKKSTSKKITKLKSGTKYYIRIRAYKTYKDSAGKKQTVYGKWVAKTQKCK